MKNIVIFDIETSPNVGYFWRPGYNLTIGPDNIAEERRIICISYKFLNDDYVYRLEWDKKQCDKKMLKEFIKVVKKADVVVGHNGDNFDVKWIKTRAIIHGLDPLNKIQSIDTLKLARNTFNFNSNKLDYIAKILKVGGKVETGGFQLWKDVMAGDEVALEKMGVYCDNDVVILEKVFLKLLPYVNNLPVHLGVMKGNGKLSCESCGSTKVHANREYPKKNGTIMKVVTCQACGSSRSMPKKKYLKLKGEV